MSAPAIEARGLCVDLAGKPVLRDVAFEIRRGESVCIIGPNGAGKTTLLKSVGALVSPSAGRIRIDGRDLTDYARKELAEHVAYVPQSAGWALSCTAREFVLMARYARFRRLGGIAAADHAAADRALAATGTEPFRDRPLKSLSGGQRQKVLIAAAFAQDAPILLLDEPSTFLDYRHEAEVLDLIERRRVESGLTVLAVGHDLNKGAFECDRVLALDAGRLVFNGPPSQLADSRTLEAIYGTRFDVMRHGRDERVVVLPVRRRP